MSLSARPGLMPRRKSSAANLIAKFQSDATSAPSVPFSNNLPQFSHARASTSTSGPHDNDDARSFMSAAQSDLANVGESVGASGSTAGGEKEEKKNYNTPSGMESMLSTRLEYWAELSAGHSGLFWMDTYQIPTDEFKKQLDPVVLKQREIQYQHLAHSISEILDQSSSGSDAFNILKLLKQMMDEYEQWVAEQSHNSSGGKMTNVFKGKQNVKLAKRPSLPTAPYGNGSMDAGPTPRFLTPNNLPADVSYAQTVASLCSVLFETYLKIHSLVFPDHPSPEAELLLTENKPPPPPLSTHQTPMRELQASEEFDLPARNEYSGPLSAGSITDDPNSYSTFLKQSSRTSIESASHPDYPPDTPSTVTAFSQDAGSYNSPHPDEWSSPPTPSSISTFASSVHSLQPPPSSATVSEFDQSSVRLTHSPYATASSSSATTPTAISRTGSFSSSGGSSVWPRYPSTAGSKGDAGGGRGSLEIGGEGAGGDAARLAKEKKSEREKWFEIITLSNKVDEKFQRVLHAPKTDLVNIAQQMPRSQISSLIDLCFLPLSPPPSPSLGAFDQLSWPDPAESFENPPEALWSWETEALERETEKTIKELSGQAGSIGEGGKPDGEEVRLQGEEGRDGLQEMFKLFRLEEAREWPSVAEGDEDGTFEGSLFA